MTSHTTTTVVTKQITSSGGTSVVTTGTRDWSSGVLGCFSDCKTCLCGYFCYPCLWCKVSKRLGEHPCVPCCVPGGGVALRTKLRLMLGIQGSICRDCCMLQCCAMCSLCQMSRELDTAGL